VQEDENYIIRNLPNLYRSSNLVDRCNKKNEIGWVCSIPGEDKKYIQYFGRKACREEVMWETQP